MKILMTICLITTGFSKVMDPAEFNERLPSLVFGKESWGKKDTAELDPLSLSPYFKASEDFVKKCFQDGDKGLLSLAIAAGRFGENTEFFQLLYNMQTIFGSSLVINRNSKGLGHRKDATNQVGFGTSHEPDVKSDEEEESNLSIPIFGDPESSDEEDENNSSHESVAKNKLNPIKVSDINKKEIEETEAYKILFKNSLSKEDENKLKEIYDKNSENKEIVLKAMLLTQRAPASVSRSLENVALFEKLFGDEFVRAYIESIVISTKDKNPLGAVTFFGSTFNDIEKNLKDIDCKTWSYKVLYPLKFLYEHGFLKNLEKTEKDQIQQALLAIENGRGFYEKQKTITEELNEIAKDLIRDILNAKGYTADDVISKLEKYLLKGEEKHEK